MRINMGLIVLINLSFCLSLSSLLLSPSFYMSASPPISLCLPPLSLPSSLPHSSPPPLRWHVVRCVCGLFLPMRELSDEYEETLLILSTVSKDRMYSSLSGLPRVLLALLLVLRLPGEKEAGPPEEEETRPSPSRPIGNRPAHWGGGATSGGQRSSRPDRSRPRGGTRRHVKPTLLIYWSLWVKWSVAKQHLKHIVSRELNSDVFYMNITIYYHSQNDRSETWHN